MGQKTHPRGLRLGIIQTWDSRWFPNESRDYAEWLQEDLKIGDFIRERLVRAAVSRVSVERWDTARLTIHIHTARPGIVIGRRGAEVERLQELVVHHVPKRHHVTSSGLAGDVIGQHIDRGVQDAFEGTLQMRCRVAIGFGRGGDDADALSEIRLMNRFGERHVAVPFLGIPELRSRVDWLR